MADHIVKATAEDELAMDYIRTIDKDADNTVLIQRVMQGHFIDWGSMYKVSGDRIIAEKYQRANQVKKDAIYEIFKDVSLEPEPIPIEEPVEEVIVP